MAEIMARASRDFTTTGAFQGVYHHRHAGYSPDRLGRTLYQIFHGVAAPVFLPYARDVEAMLRYLVDGSSPDCYPTGEDPEEFARDLEITDPLHLSAA